MSLNLVCFKLDFQPFCAPAFLRAYHGWITGLPYYIFDQLQTCLHDFLIGQFSLVNNNDGGYLRRGIFCCLLNPFLNCSRLENL